MSRIAELSATREQLLQAVNCIDLAIEDEDDPAKIAGYSKTREELWSECNEVTRGLTRALITCTLDHSNPRDDVFRVPRLPDVDELLCRAIEEHLNGQTLSS